MASESLITFPAGVLGRDPTRLPILASGPDWIALAKPAGVALGNDLLESRWADVLGALDAAIREGKPQLARLGITHAGRIHSIDAEISGVLILAVGPEAEARLRNDVGSGRWEFVYDLVTQASKHEETVMTCDLPIVRHATEARMIVSHATGKKCATTFEPVRALGRWHQWEARTRENRPHQIRVHAAERGLRIPGETVYGRVPRVYLSELKPRFRPPRGREERPLHASLALHLREIRMADAAGGLTRIEAARPKTFDVMLQRMAAAVESGPRVLRL
jgi:23S rRNA-/tRNA-specific pseudouridylate synthase